ncbi:MAG: alpha-amylase [Flavobacteriaceae bacterium]|nr:alpha-amylase [Flavobacteriaceae bacterium]
MNFKQLLVLSVSVFFIACSCEKKGEVLVNSNTETAFNWNASTVYFLLTDRFNNGDMSNDVVYDRTAETSRLRGFEGGDIQGIIQKLDTGYFTDLGVDVIWFTPVVEQIHGFVDEGTGATYGYHGYWAKDWTALDAAFGTEADLSMLVKKAHEKGIRIMLDGVINHTGPVTEKDPVWPSDWVRTEPACNYQTYETTTACTLVKNLPDVLTESDIEVELPKHLVEKWKKEGRYDQEVAELDVFFKRTGYPRAPRYYIIKWLTDYIREYGVDGYRADTVKHISETVWADFKTECEASFQIWKTSNPSEIISKDGFYLLGEVYNFNISQATAFDFGDKKVNYYDFGFDSMINFEFKYNAKDSYEALFSKYSTILNGDLKGVSVLNYLNSHDDGSPFDAERTKGYESAIKLLLSPGMAQIYYGDESNRPLKEEGAIGDANLRTNMNWEAISSDVPTQKMLIHWQKLGRFRKSHPAIGAGVHQQIPSENYTFSRVLNKDRIVVALDVPIGFKEVSVGTIFKEGTLLKDAYSGQELVVKNGKVTLNSAFRIVLLAEVL